MVPKLIRASAILLDASQNPAPIAERLKTESWAAVGKSLPQNFSDLGWSVPEKLKGTRYAAALTLPAGGTASVSDWFGHGFVHVDQIRPQMTCDEAIAANPHDQPSRLMRATVEFQARDFDAAMADYQAAIGSDARLTLDARYGVASVLYMQHRYAQALQAVNKAMMSNSGQVYTLRAMIEEALGDDDLATADAAQGYNQYNGPGEDPSQATYTLAVAYSDLGYFDASNDELAKVLERHPGDANSLAARAFNDFSLGKDDRALADFRAAVKSSPKLAQAYMGLAMTEVVRGNAAGARASLRRELALYPQDNYGAIWMLIADPHATVHVQPTAAWPGQVLRVFLGHASVESLDKAAASPDALTQSLQRCEAHFYGGMYLLQHGKRGLAIPLLRSAATGCPYPEYERPTAAQLLRRLKASSTAAN